MKKKSEFSKNALVFEILRNAQLTRRQRNLIQPKRRPYYVLTLQCKPPCTAIFAHKKLEILLLCRIDFIQLSRILQTKIKKIVQINVDLSFSGVSILSSTELDISGPCGPQMTQKQYM